MVDHEIDFEFGDGLGIETSEHGAASAAGAPPADAPASGSPAAFASFSDTHLRRPQNDLEDIECFAALLTADPPSYHVISRGNFFLFLFRATVPPSFD